MACVGQRATLRKDAVLSQSILLHSQFTLVQSVDFVANARDLRAKRLKRSLLGHLFLVRNARNHRVLVVIVLFPGNQVVLVHLLLNVCHVSVCTKHLLSLDLVVQVIPVLVLQLLVHVSLAFIEHAIEETGSLRLLRIVLLLHAIGLKLCPLGVFHLVEQLRLVFVTHTRLIILSLLRSLILKLLVAHRVAVFRLDLLLARWAISQHI